MACSCQRSLQLKFRDSEDTCSKLTPKEQRRPLTHLPVHQGGWEPLEILLCKCYKDELLMTRWVGRRVFPALHKIATVNEHGIRNQLSYNCHPCLGQMNYF